MKCIVPKPVTDKVLLSSSLTEVGVQFDPASTYAVDDTCVIDHMTYKCLVASNAGSYFPPTDISATKPHWSKLGTTNYWAMFDKYLNTQSTATGAIKFKLDASYCNAIALLNVAAEEIDVVLYSSDGSIQFSVTIDMNSTSITNWEEYFFAERFWTDTAWVEFPVLSLSSIEVTLKGGSVACGSVVLGEVKTLGSTILGATVDFTDYSIFTTDTFGGYYVAEGKYAKNIEGTCVVKSQTIQAVSRVIMALRSTPTAFYCSNVDDRYGLHEFLITYGLLKNFKSSIKRLTHIEHEFKIVGII